MTEQIYHVFNGYHYGDTILNLKFLNNLADDLEKNKITIYYYYNQQYNKNRKELYRLFKPVKLSSIPRSCHSCVVKSYTKHRSSSGKDST